MTSALDQPAPVVKDCTLSCIACHAEVRARGWWEYSPHVFQPSPTYRVNPAA